MGKNFLSAGLSHIVIPLAEPARRHRCEICLRVFECHLCTLKRDHPFHKTQRIELIEDPTIPILVCEECAVSDNCRSVESASAHRRGLIVDYYDYKTGETRQGFNRRLSDLETEIPAFSRNFNNEQRAARARLRACRAKS